MSYQISSYTVLPRRLVEPVDIGGRMRCASLLPPMSHQARPTTARAAIAARYSSTSASPRARMRRVA
jgi:hypothetical protein